jgi:hypothetical protein
LVLIGVALSPFSKSEAQPLPGYEQPPVLSASQELPEALRVGPYHKVAERVTNDGYFNNYRIESKFGRFDVEGRQLLEIRIGEMNALAELDKLSSSKVFQDAVLDSGEAMVMAPVKAVKKAANTLSDPDKMVETVQGIPDGAERLFSWAYDQAKGVAQAASDVVSSDSKDSSKSAKDSSSSALKQGKSFGLRFIGYTKRERELFRKFQVSPYTTNQPLKDEIVRVAGVGTAVGFAFKFVPSVALLSEISTFNTWYGRAEQLSLYEDPDSIREKNNAVMKEMEVPDHIAAEFQKNEAYTPWTRRFITASLADMGTSVSGRSLFIKAASVAKNEPSALYFVSVAEALEKLHKKRPLKKIVASMYLPAGVTKDTTLYVPLSVDYLFWTKEVEGIFVDFRKRVTLEESFRSVEVHVRGKVSPRARKALQVLGIAVFENSMV